jgi:hypothetical protein
MKLLSPLWKAPLLSKTFDATDQTKLPPGGNFQAPPSAAARVPISVGRGAGFRFEPGKPANSWTISTRERTLALPIRAEQVTHGLF